MLVPGSARRRALPVLDDAILLGGAVYISDSMSAMFFAHGLIEPPAYKRDLLDGGGR